MFKRKYVVWILVVLVALLSIAIGTRKKPIEAQYTVIKKQEVLETVLASGKVAGRKVVPLSFIKNGAVASIYAKEGSVVEPGDTLMALENAEEKNAVVQRRNAMSAARVSLDKLATTDAEMAQAQLRQAVATAGAAQKRFERITSLAASGAVSQQELEQARRDNDVARSARESAEAAAASLQGNQKELLNLQFRQAQTSLEEANIALARTVIRASEPGRVVKIFVNVGELVTPASPALSFLPSDTATHIELQVDEDEVYKIRPGQRTIIGIPALPESTFEASVRDIVPLVDASRGTITVQCAIGPTPHEFVPDQTVSAQIVVGAAPGSIALEKRFVIQKSGAASVFALSKGRAFSKPVTVKDIGNSLLLVTGGLVEGDTVLFGLALAPNAKIKLVQGE